MQNDGCGKKVVIVGAGQAGVSMAFRLRQKGYRGSITMIGDEVWPPYQRPPLSKKYLTGELARDRLSLKPAETYEENGIELLLDRRVARVDRAARRVFFDGNDDNSLDYETLIFATGGRPRQPHDLGDTLPENIFTLRAISDADAMRERLAPGKHLLVVGGGYIGLELAAVARKRGLKVTLLEQAPRILGRVACSQTADYFRHLHTENGVTLREGVSIESFEGPEQRPSFVKLTEGDEVSFDVAVFGIGLLPNDTIAREAGLECAGGIIVDGWGRTSDPDIRAAGDCARLPYRGDMIRLESVHNAIAQAEHIADDIVCPGGPSYAPVPWFWSDQYDCKLQIAGLNLGYTKVVTRPGTKPGAFSNWYFKGEEMIACDAINDARSFMMAKRWLAVAHRPCPELICDPSWDLAKF